jgi:hypothetical protein
MVDDRPYKGLRRRETKSALLKVPSAWEQKITAIIRRMGTSSALAVVFLASAATINAQNDDWHEKMARAKEAISAARYDEAAIVAAEAMDMVGRDNTKDPRLPDTIDVLGIAKHLQGLFSKQRGCFRMRSQP